MRRGLTGGDAAAVIGLLLFILLWLGVVAALVWWRIDIGDYPRSPEDWSVFDTVVTTALLVWPTGRAAALVVHTIGDEKS